MALNSGADPPLRGRTMSRRPRGPLNRASTEFLGEMNTPPSFRLMIKAETVYLGAESLSTQWDLNLPAPPAWAIFRGAGLGDSRAFAFPRWCYCKVCRVCLPDDPCCLRGKSTRVETFASDRINRLCAPLCESSKSARCQRPPFRKSAGGGSAASSPNGGQRAPANRLQRSSDVG